MHVVPATQEVEAEELLSEASLGKVSVFQTLSEKPN
jgi:hypothetical protein